MIKTKRLRLRKARIEDLADLHAVFSHPAAMRYWSTLPHTELRQTEDFLRGMIGASPETSADFVVECEGKAIGKAGCWRMGEIGFILHPDHWSKGYATEALEAVIPFVFERLPVDKLVADVDPRNEASLRVLGKLGFVEVGRKAKTFLLGDEWCDSVFLELPRPGTNPQS